MTNHLIIRLEKISSSFFEKDEYYLENDIIEEYSVFTDDILIAKFWMSNHYRSSIQTFIPVATNELTFILQEMKARSFKR